MAGDLISFLEQSDLVFERGFVYFEKNYYAFEKEQSLFSAEPLDKKLFKLLFRIFAEKRLKFFIETLKGVTHNVKGQISSAYARFDFIEMELEEIEEEVDIEKLDKYYEKVKSSVLGLKKILDSMTEYVATGSFRDKSFVYLDVFFDGFYNGLITDLDIKHKLIFEKEDIKKEDKIDCIPSVFQETMFYYFMSLSSLFPFSEKIKVKVSLEKAGKISVLKVESAIPPVIFDEEKNLKPHEVESAEFLNLCKDICEKNGIGFNLEQNTAEFVFGS